MGTTLGQRAVVVWLVLTGASALLYSGLASMPPLSEEPVPLVWWIVGAMALAAAVGVLRRAAWARLLGIVVAGLSALFAVWPEVYWLWVRDADLSAWLTGWQWLVPLITFTIAASALWWLVRRWPASRRQDA